MQWLRMRIAHHWCQSLIGSVPITCPPCLQTVSALQIRNTALPAELSHPLMPRQHLLGHETSSVKSPVDVSRRLKPSNLARCAHRQHKLSNTCERCRMRAIVLSSQTDFDVVLSNFETQRCGAATSNLRKRTDIRTLTHCLTLVRQVVETMCPCCSAVRVQLKKRGSDHYPLLEFPF